MSNRYKDLLQVSDLCGDALDNGLRVSSLKDLPRCYNNIISNDSIVLIENQVKNWLNEDDPDSVMFYPSLTDPLFYFMKSTIFVKTCSNGWDVYNIATSSDWSFIISSDRITQILDNPNKFKSLPNEIRSENYDSELISSKLLKEKLKRDE